MGNIERVPLAEAAQSRGCAEQRLTFLYLCIGEEEDTPTRKRVTWSESLEQRLGTAETDISVLVYR
jgi:hypothetical protein